MKRFASIDFLRGIAIVMMLVLHVVSDFLNVNAIIADINNKPLINLVAMAVLPFIGGLAGLFLMVSAVANMVSMYRHLLAGRPVGNLVLRQVLGGVVLLVFAVLDEGVIGMHGALGTLLLQLPGPGFAGNLTIDWVSFLSSGFRFETIHTIAWCIIINGIVQGIISMNGRWKNPGSLIKIYIVLAIVVVAATQFVWNGVAWLVPGYPWTNVNYGNGIVLPISYPIVGRSPFGFVVANFFLIALAAPVEPIFPYLAVSFIGSIIGIVICQPRESIPCHFTRTSLMVGMGMFVVGIIGVIYAVIYVSNAQGILTAVVMYKNISMHRTWVPDYPQYSPPYLSWLFQFMSLNGVSLMMVVLVLRMVEFRGIGAQFAKKTLPVRRYGFIAFTNYTIQTVNWLVFYAMGIVLYGIPYHQMSWGGTLISIALVLLAYYGIMLLWERVKYTGTLEWCIGTIAYNLLPGKKGTKNAYKKWWQKGQLDPQGALINADWVNIAEDRDVGHERLADSKLAFKFALIGLLSVVFIPTVFVTLRIALTSEKTEGKNKYNYAAKIVSIVGICLVLFVFWALFFITPAMLGFSILT